MKKILISLFTSFLFMYLIWLIVFMIKYDDFANIQYYHLDLHTMVMKFNSLFANVPTFDYYLNEFMDKLKQFNSNTSYLAGLENVINSYFGTGFTSNITITVLNSLINPINTIGNSAIFLCYIAVLFVQYVGIIIQLGGAVIDFIINPIFIYYVPGDSSSYQILSMLHVL